MCRSTMEQGNDREVRAAAQWWADRLAEHCPDVRIGDAMNEAFAGWVRSKIPPPTAEQIEAFRCQLEATLPAHLATNAWQSAIDSGNPRRGSALRCIGVDYGPDRILDDALVAAGLNKPWRKSLLPLKTVMWINPGSVSVSAGYNGAIVELDLDAEG